MQNKPQTFSSIAFYATLTSWVVLFSWAFMIPLKSEAYLFLTRYTARVSLVLFLCAFVASSCVRLFPNTFTRWLLKQRRVLGLSFFVNHIVHAICFGLVFWDAQVWPDSMILIFGGIEYAMLVLLAATSNDSAVKQLGPKLWSMIHKFGIYLLWVFFFYTYWSKRASGTFAWVGIAILIIGLAVRILGRLKRPHLVVLACLLFSLLSGCKSTFVRPERYDFKQDIAWREEHLQELELRARLYIGESYLVVRAAFGEPDKIFTGVYDDADERWDYIVRFHRNRIGIENFYFRKGRLVRVDFF